MKYLAVLGPSYQVDSRRVAEGEMRCTRAMTWNGDSGFVAQGAGGRNAQEEVTFPPGTAQLMKTISINRAPVLTIWAAVVAQRRKLRRDDSSNSPHIELTTIDKAFGVAESTGQGKAKAIRGLLKIRQFDFHWMLRQRVEETSMVWIIEVNGFVLDARRLKREVQEEAFQKGLIPYVPGEKPTAEKSADEEEGSQP